MQAPQQQQQQQQQLLSLLSQASWGRLEMQAPAIGKLWYFF
jgi:hypothetical protein